MRIATYNVEWFNTLFDDKGQLIDDDSWSSRWDVTKAMQTAALGAVFTAMDADAVMIIEAPDTNSRRSTIKALTHFADHFGLRTTDALIGFANDTQQEIALLYDPEVLQAAHDPRETPESPRFDKTNQRDLNVDAAPDAIRWSKPPLEVAVETADGSLRLIGVHAKSKAPHGAENKADAMRISIANRSKQLAQCIWLRKRVDEHLAEGDDLIVLGDFNDGPGLDEYEKLFGRSGVEIVLGEGGEHKLFDPHARMALGRRVGAMPTTARFRREGQPYLQALLDYVMISPGLMKKSPRWQIWHPFDHPDCYENAALRTAVLNASDHFPVILDMKL
ncbi:endonuclease/exonuclease/phosphatase family protein [Cognatiyoonia sp. IB215182]|uniref:endonuclease/exonuclease/phosphatase family protein n=1 Tax=Cognatiyoonia sp. IB215182 TaxID=3097353 RepID=UPI002A0BBCCF|nr:endonuclease/exonuclease/phosphatase family protein [Cognatiyoonia sp. IB215182]MDX8353720.1 endonuclease [Cognatiyoonia sp. IB215182]